MEPQLQTLGLWQLDPATWSLLFQGPTIPLDKNEPHPVTTYLIKRCGLQRRVTTERGGGGDPFISTFLMVLVSDVPSGLPPALYTVSPSAIFSALETRAHLLCLPLSVTFSRLVSIT